MVSENPSPLKRRIIALFLLLALTGPSCHGVAMLILDFLAVMLACALNDRMHKKLDYTQQEIRVLKDVVEALTGKKRIAFTDAQRRRLAILGKDLTPDERVEVCEIVKPATILAWFRKLVAQKYDATAKRGPGRPRTAADRRKLIVEIAEANPNWGYTKIRDALRGMKINVGRTTIADILEAAGLEPAPRARSEENLEAVHALALGFSVCLRLLQRRDVGAVWSGAPHGLLRHRATNPCGGDSRHPCRPRWRVDEAGGEESD